MNLRIESSSHSHYTLRLILAATLVVASTSIGRAQGPLVPASKPNEPTPSPGQNMSGQNQSTAKPDPNASAQQPGRSANTLTRDEAVRLALGQASAFQTAKYAELIAAEDVKQARAAFLPRITVPSTLIYNSPTLGMVAPGTPRSDRFSFISANAVAEYQALIGASGDIDLNGRLRAALRRSVALLEAAKAGTEIARRTLIQAVDDAYYGLALAIAKRRASELSLNATEEFARITDLMFNAGEVAQVDSIRAKLQLASRRDDLEQARVTEAVAAGGLRVLVGYDFADPIGVLDLTAAAPNLAEVDRFAAASITQRPELTQLDAERRAAQQEAKAARAERLPQVSYSINAGFDSNSLKPDPLHDHSGVLATVNLTIPIFDWGASRSREQQARLRLQSFESERNLALRNLTSQFHAARAQALAAAARYQFLSASVGDAERNVQASIARYRGGEAPFIEVSDAFSTLASQRAALYQALFDYQSAKARLALATGQ
ncbi:MAG TPA: TolC family protein [Blastocatellia bacterium]|nr:TolC family protein [Blastocatellia bacterium]